VQYLLAENDFHVYQGDCKVVSSEEGLREMYPVATAVELAVQSNTGHALSLHNDAMAGFQLLYNSLARCRL